MIDGFNGRTGSHSNVSAADKPWKGRVRIDEAIAALVAVEAKRQV